MHIESKNRIGTKKILALAASVTVAAACASVDPNTGRTLKISTFLTGSETWTVIVDDERDLSPVAVLNYRIQRSDGSLVEKGTMNPRGGGAGPEYRRMARIKANREGGGGVSQQHIPEAPIAGGE